MQISRKLLLVFGFSILLLFSSIVFAQNSKNIAYVPKVEIISNADSTLRDFLPETTVQYISQSLKNYADASSLSTTGYRVIESSMTTTDGSYMFAVSEGSANPITIKIDIRDYGNSLMYTLYINNALQPPFTQGG